MNQPRQQTQARTENERAITEMCALAGKPERAAAYVASCTDSSTVLAELRAEQSDPSGSRAGWRDALARTGRLSSETSSDSARRPPTAAASQAAPVAADRARAGWRDAVARVNRDHLARAGGA